MAYNQGTPTNQTEIFDDHPNFDPKLHAGLCCFEPHSPSPYEIRAGVVSRKCTDWTCFLLFCVCLLPMSWVAKEVAGADTRRLYHGYDFLGNLCGVDSQYTSKSLVYWCRTPSTTDPTTKIDSIHPICVGTCPTSSQSSAWCYDSMKVTSKTTGADGHSFTETEQFSYLQESGYATKPVMGRYCYPTDPAMTPQVTNALSASWSYRWIQAASEITSAWVPLSLAVVGSLCLGFAYMVLVSRSPQAFMYLGMVMLIGAPFVGGTVFSISYFKGGMDGFPGTGDSTVDLVAAIVCFSLFMAFLIATCLTKDTLHDAVELLEAAAHCMFECRWLQLEPLLAVGVKLAILLPMLHVLLLLLSCGEVNKVTVEQYAFNQAAGLIQPPFAYTELQWYGIAYYIFMLLWILEFCSALSYFVLAYTVELWYFTPYHNEEKEDQPPCSVFQGYRFGLIYHFGSLAMGSVTMMVTRPIRVVYALTIGSARNADGCIAQCLAACCESCMDGFSKSMEYVNKSAYMDMVVSSATFCTSAQRAYKIVMDPQWMPTVALLSGATWIFELAGAGAISAGGTLFTWFVIKLFYADPASTSYIQDPVPVLVFAAALSGFVAMAFMMVFDMVADTLLYCLAVECKRRARGIYSTEDQYVPEALSHAYKGAHHHHAYHVAGHAAAHGLH